MELLQLVKVRTYVYVRLYSHACTTCSIVCGGGGEWVCVRICCCNIGVNLYTVTINVHATCSYYMFIPVGA